MKSTLEKYGWISALYRTLMHIIHSYSFIDSSSVEQLSSTFHTIEFFPDEKQNKWTLHRQFVVQIVLMTQLIAR